MDNELPDILSKVSSTLGDRPEREEAPGPEASASLESKDGSPLVSLDFTPELMNLFWKEVERAEQRRRDRENQWDLLLNEYMPVVSASGAAETVKVQAHFRNTQTKLGALWYRSPDPILMPDDPGPAGNKVPDPRSADPRFAMSGQQFPPLTMETIISIKQEALKKSIGRDGIKMNRLMDECLFDILQWAGLAGTKTGYACTMRTIDKPKMVQGQAPPSMLGLQPAPMVPALDDAGQQIMEPVKVPIYEEYYSRRISPKKLLWDSSCTTTRFEEDCSWKGFDFFLTQDEAAAKFGLSKEDLSKSGEGDRQHEWQGMSDPKRNDLVHCIEIWCKSSAWTPDINPHPQAYNQLVLIKGLKDKPAVWRPSPDQSFDAEGRITPDSLDVSPINIMTIRDLAESCFPPSDAAFTNSDIKQMSTWRRQSIRLRDASIGKYVYDSDAFGEFELEQLKNGDIGEFIGVKPSMLKDGVDKVLAQTSKITSSPDDARGFAGIKQDMGETLGIGSNASGVETDTVRTATESDRVASAVAARNDKELSRVVDFFIETVRMIDQLQMRYMTQLQWVQLGGDDAGPIMMAWNRKTVMGKYIYDIAPDSQLRPDSAKEYQLLAQHYNLTAKDPLSNRAYLLKRMARSRGMDPAKAVLPPPPPPPPKKEPLKISLTITAQDLKDPVVMAWIAAFEDHGTAPSVNLKGEQPEHGGPAEPGDVISQHMQSNSGGKENAPGASNHREEQVK